jgi:hypothetical protein
VHCCAGFASPGHFRCKDREAELIIVFPCAERAESLFRVTFLVILIRIGSFHDSMHVQTISQSSTFLISLYL